ncbi:MAG: NAD(P)/FAD-dependent oxidoreductase [Janthinobacterium lividum]
MDQQPYRKTRIVVVGGGAGGLELVRKLGVSFSKQKFDVILVDRNSTHIWKPLLHEVAAGSLDANLDEVGYASHAHRWGYRYFDGTLSAIDREARQIVIAPILGEDGTELVAEHRVGFDYLVLAMGSVSNDFGTPGVRANCVFLDERAQADRFRRLLLNQCLRVSRSLDRNPASDACVNVAIVGGGATGVELAAELNSAAKSLASLGVDGFDSTRLHITLVEAGPRLLPALTERLAESARSALTKLNVRVLTSTQITEASPKGLRTSTGEMIESDLMVWAAGVKGADALHDIGGLKTTKRNHIEVLPTLQTTLDPHIYAIGDCAYFELADKRPVPPRAQAAHQMAATAFYNIRADLTGKPMTPFVYRDHGSLVSLSRNTAVGSLMGNLVGGRMAIQGRLARFFYVSLYRMHLLAIHGWMKGTFLILIGHVNQIARPKLKLH